MPQHETAAARTLSADVVVVGSGIAGLFVALQASERGASALIVTKGAVDEANTRYAQGGIAAAIDEHDSPEQHLRDTIEAGAGLVDEVAARVLCSEAPGRVADLVRYGVRFDTDGGSISLGREGAHAGRRVLRARGDQTGLEIELSLSSLVQRHGITVIEHAPVERVLVEDGRAVGVETLVRGGKTLRCESPSVVLATGGAGRLYRFTTNIESATGDGIALAFRAGAEVRDMEFTQFHPTAMHRPDAPVFLISEAVRGEGALLLDTSGERFMPAVHPLAELAPRDVVARAMVARMRETGADCVYLDVSQHDADWLATRFPNIYRTCMESGIDMARDPIPVSPAAHYTMGGVRTNTWGETTLPGLHAVGEVTSTGVHGANRLASNSLLESVVFARRLSDRLFGDETAEEPLTPSPGAQTLPPAGGAPAAEPPTREAVQRLMWERVGIERDADGLADAVEQLAAYESALPPTTTLEDHELRSVVACGRLAATAALLREESRGAHYRRDFPEPLEAWRRHLVFRAGE
ncbi:MAG: L-aspartate oxidase [Chloroflexi bacterium]|nr:L-aspartate oxidase [Chloroflexota bacterium]